MYRPTKAGIWGSVVIAATVGISSWALADAGNAGTYDGMLHSPTVATSSAPTVTAPTLDPHTYVPTCDGDFCTMPDVTGRGEWLFYVDGVDKIGMWWEPYPIDARVAVAS